MRGLDLAGMDGAEVDMDGLVVGGIGEGAGPGGGGVSGGGKGGSRGGAAGAAIKGDSGTADEDKPDSRCNGIAGGSGGNGGGRG